MAIFHGTAIPSSGDFYEHLIEQSLRFNDDDTAYLSWTPSVDRSANVWTVSFWFKRGNLGSSSWFPIWEADNGANSDSIGIYQDKLSFSLASAIRTVTIPDYFRDPSAWYHLVISWDTNETGLTDTLKIWLNGVRKTSYSAYINSLILDSDTLNFGRNVENRIGARTSGTVQYFDGYLAEFNFIDGTALDASSFGESKSGTWIPKAYSGSYGTNGFYLDFGNSGSIGADVSGNGNNFTANNLATTDVVLDSPTNNFATLGCPVRGSYQNEIQQEGNLQTTSSGASNAFGTDFSTFSIPPNSGKWYVEMYVKSQTTFYPMLNLFDVTNPTQQVWAGEAGQGFTWFATGTTYWNDTQSATRSSFTTGDLLSLAYDSNTGKVFIAKNGTWENSGNPAAGTGSVATLTSNIEVTFAVSVNYSVVAVTNFGQDSSFAGNKTAQGNTDGNGYGDFYYAPPTGYLALCTANIQNDMPESLDPAQDGSPQDHFNTVLYTGTGGTQSVTGVGFQPDLIWTKKRSGVANHSLHDVIRGTGTNTTLSSSLTNSETGTLDGTYGYMSSIDADGFTAVSGSTDGNYINNSGDTYAAWNWKANGSGVSNTVGSITSTVSANTDAGFSIVSYSGNSTTNSTVGHGLTQEPEMIIIKARDYSSGVWTVYFKDVVTADNSQLQLDSTAALIVGESATRWDISANSNSVFGLSSSNISSYTNSSAYDYIAYCFHSVEGFSKFGSYTGNGSGDGTFAYTGFKPAFVMIKRTDSSGWWHIWDIERDTYNYSNHVLFPNESNAESVYTPPDDPTIDILSNGFKQRSTYPHVNASGGSYIYMAFAENPFKYANAR